MAEPEAPAEVNTHDGGKVSQRREVLEKYRSLLVGMIPERGFQKSGDPDYPDVPVSVHELALLLNFLSISLYGYHGSADNRCLYERYHGELRVRCMRCGMYRGCKQDDLKCGIGDKNRPSGLIPAPMGVIVDKRRVWGKEEEEGKEVVDRDLGPVDYDDD